jgi:hypothetical protein
MRSAAIATGLALAAAAAIGTAVTRGDEERKAAPAFGRPAELDLRTTLGHDARFLEGFDTSAMYVATGVNGIRSIDRPIFERPREAAALLPLSALVLGLERGGEAHAYPIDLLSLHEIVNDVVGGTPVAVTWCPLCSTGLAYDRRAGGRTVTLGVSGYLYGGNLVMYDRETGSLWPQLLGGAVTGRLRGTRLRWLPVVQTTWAKWLAAHPDTVVLSIRRDSLARKFLAPETYVSARGVEEGDQPYATYVTKLATRFPRVVRGLLEGATVVGLVRRGQSKAYPLERLRRRGSVMDRLAGEPLLVVYHGDTAFSASVFSRRVNDGTLTFARTHEGLFDRETGSRWSPATGRAISGPLAGVRLAALPSTTSYWFAWRRFYPETALYGESQRDAEQRRP